MDMVSALKNSPVCAVWGKGCWKNRRLVVASNSLASFQWVVYLLIVSEARASFKSSLNDDVAGGVSLIIIVVGSGELESAVELCAIKCSSGVLVVVNGVVVVAGLGVVAVTGVVETDEEEEEEVVDVVVDGASVRVELGIQRDCCTLPAIGANGEAEVNVVGVGVVSDILRVVSESRLAATA